MRSRCGNTKHLLSLAALCAFLLGLSGPACAEEAADANHDHRPNAHVGHEGGASSHAFGDLMLFPGLAATQRSADVSGLRQSELFPEINVFYSLDRARLRFLAEYLLNRDEHEMERFQLGWVVRPSATLWLGRFHSPLGFWNSEHHHGAFMQTTISRPGILAFEDEGGVLPTHVTGVLVEGALDRGDGAVNYAFGFGRGPVLESELKPLDVLDPESGGRLAAVGRVSRVTGRFGEFGASAAYAHIPIVGRVVDETVQTLAGVFYVVRVDNVRLLGELFYVRNRLSDAGAARTSSFGAGYLQGEYAPNRWTLFTRLEGSHDAEGNDYLDLNPHYVEARAMVGARREMSDRQALKVELSRNERQDDAGFTQLSLQWSMVYP